MQHFQRISFLLGPQELHTDAVLCEYVELEGRERALFRSFSDGWPPAVEAARTLPLGAGARRAYLGENAMRLFNFPFEVEALESVIAIGRSCSDASFRRARQLPTISHAATCATGCSLIASNSLRCRPAKLVMGWNTTANRYFYIGCPTRQLVWCADPQLDRPKGPRRAPTW